MIIQGDARQLKPDSFNTKFRVIAADCPWPYQQFSERKQGAAKAIYELMTVEELCNMPVKNLAANDSVLLLWGTWPKLPEALQVMKAWSFEYVTGFPWIKLDGNGVPIYGIGFWVRGCSEFVFIGRKGNVSPPRLEGFLGLMSPNLHHSRKPDSLHEYAETLPGPYLELFARRDRKDWYCFGNQFEEINEVQTNFIKEKSIIVQLEQLSF
jgi:N6-adenosine-specific RNA methylase IME4